MRGFVDQRDESDAAPLLPETKPTAPTQQLPPLRVYGDGLTRGAWVSDAWNPCESGVNCCMASCVPCVSLAQISQRIGWASYWKVLHTLLMIYAIESFMSAIFVIGIEKDSHRPIVNWLQARYDENSPLFLAAAAGTAALETSSFFNSISGLAMILVTMSLRRRIRTMFQIPGSGCNDAAMSFCCTCCAIAQMATHVKSYEKGTCDVGPVDTLPGYELDKPRPIGRLTAEMV